MKNNRIDADRRGKQLAEAASRLAEEVNRLAFSPPVTYVYNPLDYAWETYTRYLELYGSSRKRVIFWGMNPGPWGMAQTGVPFGEIGFVREWLKIEGTIGSPDEEHPKRRITGFSCLRSEVSGQRLWSLFSRRFNSPAEFFKDHFVANYCPLLFVESSGRNRTPDKLPASEREGLFEACDAHLLRTVEILEPEWMIGIGGFAENRLKAADQALKDGTGSPVNIGKILHPSPASPVANRGWEKAAESQLQELGVWPAT